MCALRHILTRGCSVCGVAVRGGAWRCVARRCAHRGRGGRCVAHIFLLGENCTHEHRCTADGRLPASEQCVARRLVHRSAAPILRRERDGGARVAVHQLRARPGLEEHPADVDAASVCGDVQGRVTGHAQAHVDEHRPSMSAAGTRAHRQGTAQVYTHLLSPRSTGDGSAFASSKSCTASGWRCSTARYSLNEFRQASANVRRWP